MADLLWLVWEPTFFKNFARSRKSEYFNYENAKLHQAFGAVSVSSFVKKIPKNTFGKLFFAQAISMFALLALLVCLLACFACFACFACLLALLALLALFCSLSNNIKKILRDARAKCKIFLRAARAKCIIVLRGARAKCNFCS